MLLPNSPPPVLDCVVVPNPVGLKAEEAPKLVLAFCPNVLLACPKVLVGCPKVFPVCPNVEVDVPNSPPKIHKSIQYQRY